MGPNIYFWANGRLFGTPEDNIAEKPQHSVIYARLLAILGGVCLTGDVLYSSISLLASNSPVVPHFARRSTGRLSFLSAWSITIIRSESTVVGYDAYYFLVSGELADSSRPRNDNTKFDNIPNYNFRIDRPLDGVLLHCPHINPLLNLRSESNIIIRSGNI